jgi:serine protease AprX
VLIRDEVTTTKFAIYMSSPAHKHQHSLNQFAVIPTELRLKADKKHTGKGVTIAYLDSGFSSHPDLTEPENRIIAYADVSNEPTTLDSTFAGKDWQWHGTQTSVAAAGNGRLSDGVYRGLASESTLVLVKVSENGRITEDNIERGLHWILQNRSQYNIRILNISLAGDEDVPCSRSAIDKLAEQAVREGIVVVAAAGNSSEHHSIPPANSPNVITVGGYSDNNRLDEKLELYNSNFGQTVDGTLKPELIAPAMCVAAPILLGTPAFDRAEALSRLIAAPNYELPRLFKQLHAKSGLTSDLLRLGVATLRGEIESALKQHKVVATHYQHVDGTSFAAPIVSSIAAQMIEANPSLAPAAIKNILISTADRIANAAVLRQGYGVVNARRAVEVAKKERHQLETSGCSETRIANDRIVFVHHDDEARSVFVAGDFNGWLHSDTPMTKDEAGLWRVSIPKPSSGKYQYKFVIDDSKWVEDANNGWKVPDNYGGLNSLLVVE